MTQRADGATALGPFIARYVERMLAGGDGLAAALEDLTLEEVHYRPAEGANTIGWDAWHVARTADNVVHFVFLREPPVWRQQRLDEAWSLPRNIQGTGMDAAEAQALRFPEPRLLARYVRDVSNAIVPRIEAMHAAYLADEVDLQPLGRMSRLDALGRSVLTHGYSHLGHINLARTLLGKSGLGF